MDLPLVTTEEILSLIDTANFKMRRSGYRTDIEIKNGPGAPTVVQVLKPVHTASAEPRRPRRLLGPLLAPLSGMT
jgi:hypothetical protein